MRDFCGTLDLEQVVRRTVLEERVVITEHPPAWIGLKGSICFKREVRSQTHRDQF